MKINKILFYLILLLFINQVLADDELLENIRDGDSNVASANKKTRVVLSYNIRIGAGMRDWGVRPFINPSVPFYTVPF